MSIQNEKELKGILRVGKFVGRLRDFLMEKSKEGISTFALDQMAKVVFEKAGALSAPKHDYKFPGYTCISVNHEIAHGIPSRDRILKDGDLVNIDVSARLDDFYADTGISFVVGDSSSQELRHLCEVAKLGTEAAINVAHTGNLLRHLGREIQQTANRNGFKVIKNLAGHGTGRKLHEEPEVLVYENKRDKRTLTSGLVLAIESFVSTRSEMAVELSDGWTLSTLDRSYVAQCEHTVIVMDGQAIVATR
ncbi:type I methionyl aminopeptidase [Leptospira ognonensis]|uniref:Methionine aminopeptidase n=1 Tax=Leptospira ognonensis TaxID=2484945 RepID=A0A4R9K6B8_9LEPT|nr:type I methionyl aminopeptidase [Leptospira ognonensis]TGL60178.1 type I methionyl aminopeptidase [Leptospira ognonensis]